jgi:hypothetical protein
VGVGDNPHDPRARMRGDAVLEHGHLEAVANGDRFGQMFRGHRATHQHDRLTARAVGIREPRGPQPRVEPTVSK